VDFPGLVAATVFTQGCNFRCGYCHNPELVLLPSFQSPVPPELIFDYLNGRKGKLEGVVLTGGEPTLQKGLADFIRRVKEMGFSVKLDTNGSHPEVLASLFELNLLDYVAMDIKTSLRKYDQIASMVCDVTKIQGSIYLIKNSGIPYQFRTTLIKEFCSNEDLDEIKDLIGEVKHYVLQPVVISQKMIDSHLDHQNQYTSVEVESLKFKYDVRGLFKES